MAHDQKSITLHSFGDNDRSGKVRWLAHELGFKVTEVRVELGAHRRPPYRELNFLAQIPSVEYHGQVLIESTAVCHQLAESTTAPKLWIEPGHTQRQSYLFWLALAAETLEGRLVESILSEVGILPAEHRALHEKALRFKLRESAKKLPAEGYLCGDFTIADIVLGYSLRLGLQCGLVERSQLDPYFGRLLERPAAHKSRFFAGLLSK